MTKPNKLRELRKALCFTQQELTVKAGVSIATINLIEKYNYIPGSKVKEKLVQALGMEDTVIWPDGES